MSSTDIKALMNLNIATFLGIDKADEKDKITFLSSYSELIWYFFFMDDAKELPQEDLGKITEYGKKKDYKKILEIIQKKFPDAQERLITNELRAKKRILLIYLEGVKQSLMKPKEMRDNELLKDIESSIELIHAEKWKEFTQKDMSSLHQYIQRVIRHD